MATLAEPEAPARPSPITAPFRAVWFLLRRIASVVGMMVLLGLSLLPLSSLLLMLPAIMPQESVLTDTKARSRFWILGLFGRVFAVVTGLAVLIGLLAGATE